MQAYKVGDRFTGDAVFKIVWNVEFGRIFVGIDWR